MERESSVNLKRHKEAKNEERRTKGSIMENITNISAQEDDVLNWLYSGNINGRLHAIRSLRLSNSGNWFLKEFHNWIEGPSKLMTCPGERTPP